MPIHTLDEAIAYIESFAIRSQAAGEPQVLPLKRQATRFPKMAQLLALLGNPHHKYHTIHVTGTSGKGSTATMLAAILQQAASGVIGLYTNPYVLDPRERILINRRYVDPQMIIASANLVQEAIGTMHADDASFIPHLKEIWVAVTFVAFALARVDYAVIEVGMGGRFDETNVITPDIAVITTVGFDHMEFLGSTIIDIAWHKAGIIKDHVPVVVGVPDQTARSVIIQEAFARNAPMRIIGQDFFCEMTHQDQHGITITYSTATQTWNDIFIALVGQHQASNAALAIRAVQEIVPNLSQAQVQRALSHIWLPGRFEILSNAVTIILDVAHNSQKMQACIATLRSVMTWQRIILIFGALGTKNINEMLGQWQLLQPLVIATAPAVVGRIVSPAETTAHIAQSLGMETYIAQATDEAIAMAMNLWKDGDIIIVTGSLFLVSQIRKALATRFPDIHEIV